MPKRQYTKWTKEMVMEIAAKYQTAGDFHDNDNKAYMTARRRGWLEDACAHMYSARFVWTDELISEEAKKYQTRSDFAEGSRAAYSAAARRNLLGKVCKHMPRYSGKGKTRGPNVRTTQAPTPVDHAKSNLSKLMGL